MVEFRPPSSAASVVPKDWFVGFNMPFEDRDQVETGSVRLSPRGEGRIGGGGGGDYPPFENEIGFAVHLLQSSMRVDEYAGWYVARRRRRS